jgi:hypothetical protein
MEGALMAATDETKHADAPEAPAEASGDMKERVEDLHDRREKAKLGGGP